MFRHYVQALAKWIIFMIACPPHHHFVINKLLRVVHHLKPAQTSSDSSTPVSQSALPLHSFHDGNSLRQGSSGWETVRLEFIICHEAKFCNHVINIEAGCTIEVWRWTYYDDYRLSYCKPKLWRPRNREQTYINFRFIFTNVKFRQDLTVGACSYS